MPPHPHLDVPKQQARELLGQCKTKSTDALGRFRRRHPRFHTADDDTISSRLKLSDAQLIIAREYGFSSWAELKQRHAANLGRLDMVKTIAILGAKDLQHAFSHALLQGSDKKHIDSIMMSLTTYSK